MLPMNVARAVAVLLEGYVLAGLVFAVAFVSFGITRIDPRVATSPRTLRVILFPGVAAMWPLFARRWMTGAPQPIENNPHRAAAARRPTVNRVATGLRPAGVVRKG